MEYIAHHYIKIDQIDTEFYLLAKKWKKERKKKRKKKKEKHQRNQSSLPGSVSC